ncbi:CTP:molybdopterin cytidylyltransferase MocA [Loktanella fryxellensis]|uniref:CTP:molybdopterin cytidylyltransferase MocA n=1 Tax=Loktanella fryxellensis TaxID=245187 RepID=A0A1H7Y6A5_9RHOB|nr:nucleotidyltransferase family protein [Loktanella fryxellensis]SEM41533.1 CTP:molybdopterin cytidylyltransferase MocA [Loktanella fryxellensis]
MTPILILAAGLSTRMRGVDKLAQDVGGVPLLRRIVQQAATVGPIYVALHHRAAERRALLAGLDVTALHVPEAAEGQSGTLRGGVARLPDCAAFMVLLADLPLLTGPDLAAVVAARAAHPDALIWRGATPDGRPGHPLLFDASLRPGFAALSGDDGGAALVRPLRHRTHLVPFADDRALFDLDTPEAWAAFRARPD